MRVALGIEYAGHGFHGWQSQVGLPTVQAALEAGLSRVANHPIFVVCAGRTDAGVHALQQVVHFDVPASACSRPLSAWVYGTNTHLPDSVRVLWARAVPADFHARFHALARQYVYLIYHSPVSSPLLRERMTWVRAPLCPRRMHEAAQYLVGEKDFSAFRASTCQSVHARRRIMHIAVQKPRPSHIYITIKANAFLHHMVRNIVGSLLLVGREKQPVNWLKTVLHCLDRRQAGQTAPPHGLYLQHVDYPNTLLAMPDLRDP